MSFREGERQLADLEARLTAVAQEVGSRSDMNQSASLGETVTTAFEKLNGLLQKHKRLSTIWSQCTTGTRYSRTPLGARRPGVCCASSVQVPALAQCRPTFCHAPVMTVADPVCRWLLLPDEEIEKDLQPQVLEELGMTDAVKQEYILAGVWCTGWALLLFTEQQPGATAGGTPPTTDLPPHPFSLFPVTAWCADEERIRGMISSLDDFSRLKEYVNTASLQELPTLNSKMKPLEAVHISQTELAAEQHERTIKLLEAYNAIVNMLSKKFVYWDAILSAAEQASV